MPRKTKKKTDPADAIRTAVKDAMARQDHSQSDLATGTGIGRTDLLYWLNGDRDLKVSKLAKVMAHLGLTIAPGVVTR